MKILLVTPVNRSYVVMPSLGLGYLASVSREAGHDVTILDCLKERMTHESFERYIRGNRFDVVGFQAFSYDLHSIRKHLEAVRSAGRGAVTVAGGAHPSGDPVGTLAYLKHLDFAFRGEAEIGFPILLERLEAGNGGLESVPGLVWRKDGDARVNPVAHEQDLDRLPMPAWDLLKPESYPEAPHGAFTLRFPTAPIVITRGCPFLCTFCAGKSITGPKVRKRTVENVIAELKLLRDRGVREFHVEDENFTAHRRLVVEFCERLIRENLGMTWSLPSGVRIDSLEAGTLRLMEKSGCYSMALGIEFGTQRIMELTKKRLTPELVREKLELFRGLSIKTTGFFLFGIPGETIGEMRKTVEFALSLPIERAQFNNFMPLPGSELWDRLSAAGKLENVDWSRFFVHDVAFSDDGIDPRDIKRLQRQAYLRFYARPRIVWNLLREIRSPRHLRFLLKRFLDALS